MFSRMSTLRELRLLDPTVIGFIWPGTDVDHLNGDYCTPKKLAVLPLTLKCKNLALLRTPLVTNEISGAISVR